MGPLASLTAVAACLSFTPTHTHRQSLPSRSSRPFAVADSPLEMVPVASSSSLEAAVPPSPSSWVSRLNKVSNFASILCAIDCTVFPLLLTIMPIINVAGGGTEWLHTASHAVALWFVAPVGGAAVLSNFLQHKRAAVFAWGLSGILLVLLANVHLPHSILGWHVLHALDHFLHARHSAINIFGCVLLLSSQRYAHSLVCCDHDHGSDCDHDHSHSHSH